MLTKALVIVCLGFLLSTSAIAQQQPEAPQRPAQPSASQPLPAQPAVSKPSYEDLLAQVKKQDPAVDFKELRLTYTETKQYTPYGNNRDARNTMFAAIQAKDYDKALAQSELILSGNYVDLFGHFGAFAAHRELGHPEKSTHHKYVLDGLFKSIRESGDGKSTDTAIVVISTDEEYAFFSLMGLKLSSQALMHDKGHAYDQMTVLDPETNKQSVLFFNIDKPFNWLGKSLKN